VQKEFILSVYHDNLQKVQIVVETSKDSADSAVLVQITGSGGQKVGSILSHINKSALGQTKSYSDHLGETKDGLVQSAAPGIHGIGPHVLEG